MKKFYVVSAVAVGFLFVFSSVKSQEIERSVGIRFGAHLAELSYHQPLFQISRLEADFGVDYKDWSGMSLSVLYDFVFDFDQLGPGLNWFVGFGGAAGLFRSSFVPGILVNGGIQYNFNIPLQFTIDWRPGYYFNSKEGNYFIFNDFAASVRYIF